MKISYRWLQEYVDCHQTPVEELADLLTMAGLEVEGIETRRYCIPAHVMVGKILDVQHHSEASALFVCQVDVGERGLRVIVCGAPNTVPGVNVPVALPGAELPNGITVGEAKIRGVLSQGMICAEDELGISDDHSGILILAQDAPIGKPLLPEMLTLEDDAILEIGLTPNRGDCLSHIGVAREVATLLKSAVTFPSITYSEEGEQITNLASVTIEDPDLCYRYTASVISGVEIGSSPVWIKRRLEHVGIRSINNVVDVTNFVMMELGQPLHAFDLAKLEGQKIIVRRAQAGEVFTTLDGVERQLDEDMLMIADQQRRAAIGGVMGGLNSEVSDATTDILLESACFAPLSIRKTSKKLGLSTEASHRFERSVDPLGVNRALRRATQLIVELAGGKVAQGILDVFPYTYTPTQVSLRFSRVQDILGTHIEIATIRNILLTLGFQKCDESEQMLQVEVPSYRPDIEREIDLIEEVGRIYGYDNIPTGYPSGKIPPKKKNTRRDVEKVLRDVLVGQGVHEVINYSFFDQTHLEKLSVVETPPYNKVVALRNPLTVEQGVLRTTTIPGLLQNVLVNRSNRVENIRLFEIGNVFIHTDSSDCLPDENVIASGVLAGSRMDRGWTYTQEPLDFYDAKGIVENIMRSLQCSYEFRRTEEIAFLHPGESATVHIQDELVGFVGKLHPDVPEAFDIDEEQVYAFELVVDVLTKHTSSRKTFQTLPKFPAVYRDLALIVPESLVSVADIDAVIQEAGRPLLEHVILFDRYVGTQIPQGNVGLTYSLQYRSSERTLTDHDVSEIHQRIVEQLQTRLEIQLR